MPFRHRGVAAVIAVLVAAAGCSKKDDAAGESQPKGTAGDQAAEKPDGKGRVVASLTVDWEGAYLNPEALDALSELRDELPGVPLTHFVSAAYFTKPDVIPGAREEIDAALRPEDEAALHIHAWHSLAEAAGVEPRSEPSFLDPELLVFPDGDRGFEVPLSAYSVPEVRKLVSSSRKLLADNGIEAKVSFRAGGYAASPGVLAAVRAEGYLVDSSASWPGWYEEGEGRFHEHMQEQWGDIERLQQPYFVDTPAGKILEMPNTGSFVEYATADEMQAHVREALAAVSARPDRDVFINIGLHQETAHDYRDQLLSALGPIREQAGERLVFLTVADAAKRARAQLEADAASRGDQPPTLPVPPTEGTEEATDR